ncbi:MAG: 2'-5' RNA ligase family protein [Anaerolineae bacterium]|nr:2'-5' RNA ligase family protein [Anaerolineae bacterium]
MAHAVEMYFDEATDSAVRGMWQSIAATGVPSAMLAGGYRPHVTLAVYDDLKDDGWFASTLEVLAGVAPPVSLTLSSYGIFPGAEGVLFLGVTVTDALCELHGTFHTWFTDYQSSSRAHYAPDQWVPHCTLALGLSLDEMAKALQACQGCPLPLTAQVTAFGLVEVSPISYREIAVFASRPLD